MWTCARAALGVLGLAGVALAAKCRRMKPGVAPVTLQQYCYNKDNWPSTGKRSLWQWCGTGTVKYSPGFHTGCPSGTTHCCMRTVAPVTLAPSPAPSPATFTNCASFSGGVCGDVNTLACQTNGARADFVSNLCTGPWNIRCCKGPNPRLVAKAAPATAAPTLAPTPAPTPRPVVLVPAIPVPTSPPPPALTQPPPVTTPRPSQPPTDAPQPPATTRSTAAATSSTADVKPSAKEAPTSETVPNVVCGAHQFRKGASPRECFTCNNIACDPGQTREGQCGGSEDGWTCTAAAEEPPACDPACPGTLRCARVTSQCTNATTGATVVTDTTACSCGGPTPTGVCLYGARCEREVRCPSTPAAICRRYDPASCDTVAAQVCGSAGPEEKPTLDACTAAAAADCAATTGTGGAAPGNDTAASTPLEPPTPTLTPSRAPGAPGSSGTTAAPEPEPEQPEQPGTNGSSSIEGGDEGGGGGGGMSGGAVAGVVVVCLLAAALLAAGVAYACREKDASMRSTNPNYNHGSSKGLSTTHQNPGYAGPDSIGGGGGAEDGGSGCAGAGDGTQKDNDHIGDYDPLAGSTPQTRGENDTPNGYGRLSLPQSGYDHLAGSTPPAAGGAPNSYNRLVLRDGAGSSVGYYEAMNVRTATPAAYHAEGAGSADERWACVLSPCGGCGVWPAPFLIPPSRTSTCRLCRLPGPAPACGRGPAPGRSRARPACLPGVPPPHVVALAASAAMSLFQAYTAGDLRNPRGHGRRRQQLRVRNHGDAHRRRRQQHRVRTHGGAHPGRHQHQQRRLLQRIRRGRRPLQRLRRGGRCHRRRRVHRSGW